MRLQVVGGRELGRDGAADLLRRRVGRAQVGHLLLERLEPPHLLVEVGVVEGRVVEHVVAPPRVLDLLGQRPVLLPELGIGVGLADPAARLTGPSCQAPADTPPSAPYGGSEPLPDRVVRGQKYALPPVEVLLASDYPDWPRSRHDWMAACPSPDCCRSEPEGASRGVVLMLHGGAKSGEEPVGRSQRVVLADRPDARGDRAADPRGRALAVAAAVRRARLEPRPRAGAVADPRRPLGARAGARRAPRAAGRAARPLDGGAYGGPRGRPPGGRRRRRPGSVVRARRPGGGPGREAPGRRARQPRPDHLRRG